MNICSWPICWTFMYAFLANSVAEDQQLMVCKPLSSVFETRPTNSTNQFPFPTTNKSCQTSKPGKQGPRGLRGPPGPIGPPGAVAANQSNEISSLQAELRIMQSKMQCMDGILVGNTCYKLPYRVGVGVNYEEARSICAFHGMSLAEIPTEEAYDAVYEYVQRNWYLMIDREGDSYVDFWLGTIYNGGGNIVLSNGQQGFARWHPDYPLSTSGSTRILVRAATKPQHSPTIVGMANVSPTRSTPVPICQFQI